MKTTLPVCLAVILATLAFPRPSGGASGDNDFTFALRGAVDGPIYAVAVDSRTNIWIGGSFNHVYGKPYANLAVLNADGSLNETLANGFSAPNGVILALAVDYADRVYAGGRYGVTRVDPTGGGFVLDATFSCPIQQVTSLALRYPDTLWVAGQDGLFRFEAGVRDTSFQLSGALGPQYVAQVRYVPPGASQNATVGEHLLLAGGFGVAIASVNGEVLGGSVYGGAAASCVAERGPIGRLECGSAHGDLIGAGDFESSFVYNYTYPSEFGLFLNRFGGVDSGTYFHGLSSTTNSSHDRGYSISGVEALDGGDLLVIGEFSQLGGANANNIAHLLPDGKVDAYFQNNLGFHPAAMAKQPDGKYVIVGYGNFTPLTGQLARRLALEDPRPVTFPIPPVSQTVYEGDGAAFSAGVDAWPAPNLAWLKDGVALPGETTSALYFYSAGLADAGAYRLEADTFCAGLVESPTAKLTVLPAPPAPPNDAFTNAVVLSGAAPTGTGYIRSATTEPGELDHANSAQGRSVWYRWTAGFDGQVLVDLSQCDFTAAVGVYTGDRIDNLALVTNNCLQVCFSSGEGGTFCFCQGPTNFISFPATSNVTYQIAIGGAPNAGSLGNLSVALKPAIVLAPRDFSFSGSGLHFDIDGPRGLTVIIEATRTLSPPNWKAIATNVLTAGVNTILDAYSATNRSCYYRARLP